jgi:hypothetical protein
LFVKAWSKTGGKTHFVVLQKISKQIAKNGCQEK